LSQLIGKTQIRAKEIHNGFDGIINAVALDISIKQNIMKRYSLIMIMLLMLGGSAVVESCKSKKTANTTEQSKPDSDVQVSDDKTLRTSVDEVIKNYGDVKADVDDGVVTLKGTIERDSLQNLIMKIQELKPKKVENQLVIK
jgi:hypothetical protein